MGSRGANHPLVKYGPLLTLYFSIYRSLVCSRLLFFVFRKVVYWFGVLVKTFSTSRFTVISQYFTECWLLLGPLQLKFSPCLKPLVMPLFMIYMISLTKPLEQTFCFGIYFDGIDTFDHRIWYFVQFNNNIFCNEFFPVVTQCTTNILGLSPIGVNKWTSWYLPISLNCEQATFHFAFQPKLFHDVFNLHAPPNFCHAPLVGCRPDVENHWSR